MQEEAQEKKIVIGDYKLKNKFIEFIGSTSNINFISNEAFVEGRYFSGLEIDDVIFKLTICDEGTVNFDEVESDRTTFEQRGRLLESLDEKPASPYNKRMVLRDVPFKSVQKIKDIQIKLYLAVEYQTPISRLASIFEDQIEINSDQISKLDDLLSIFDDETIESETIESETMDIPVSTQIEEVSIVCIEDEEDNKIEPTDAQKRLIESYNLNKEEKIKELEKRLAFQKNELKRYEYEKSQAEKKIDTATTDIRVLDSRIESLKPLPEPNGYYFFVSELLNEKVILDETLSKIIFDKVSKVKSINAKAFMKLFEEGEYTIKIGTMIDGHVQEFTDYENLPENIKKTFTSIGINLQLKNEDSDSRLVYLGEMSWHSIVDKMIKSGFTQDHNFDKLCGSNSYFVKYDKNTPEKTDISDNLES